MIMKINDLTSSALLGRKLRAKLPARHPPPFSLGPPRRNAMHRDATKCYRMLGKSKKAALCNRCRPLAAHLAPSENAHGAGVRTCHEEHLGTMKINDLTSLALLGRKTFTPTAPTRWPAPRPSNFVRPNSIRVAPASPAPRPAILYGGMRTTRERRTSK